MIWLVMQSNSSLVLEQNAKNSWILAIHLEFSATCAVGFSMKRRTPHGERFDPTYEPKDFPDNVDKNDFDL